MCARRADKPLASVSCGKRRDRVRRFAGPALPPVVRIRPDDIFRERHLKRERRKSLCHQDYGVFGSTGVASVDLAERAFGSGYGSAAGLVADSITEYRLPRPHRVPPVVPQKKAAGKTKKQGDSTCIAAPRRSE